MYVYIYNIYIYTDILNVVCKLEDPKIVYVTQGECDCSDIPPLFAHTYVNSSP